MTLELTYERCVRTRSVAASCRACVDACPTGAISLGGPRHAVMVALDDCVECGACQGACPMDAFHGVVDVAALVAARPREIACGQAGLPCVGALSSEELLTMALSSGRLVVTARDCAAGAASHERARLNLERARVFARAFGAVDVVLQWRDEAGSSAPPVRRRPSVPARRQFLGLLVPKVAIEPRQLTSPERLDVAAIRAVGPTARRQRLLAELPPSPRPSVESLPAESVACSSMKRIDAASCTACLLCVTACPTGALSTPRLHQEILFDPRRCVKCNLCEDGCEPHALTSKPEVSLTDFVDGESKVLVRFQVSQCGECGATFQAQGPDEGSCPSCRAQHAEARALWGHS